MEEIERVSYLIREAYLQYKSMLSPKSWEFYLGAISDLHTLQDKSELIVAEVDSSLAGTVTLQLRMPDSAKEGWPHDWAGIRLLAVHPDYRGRGIGSALMEECVYRCRNNGNNTIALHTTEIMNAARHIYLSMGFRHMPEYDFRPSSEIEIFAYRLDLHDS